jgi:hypothetical protein
MVGAAGVGLYDRVERNNLLILKAGKKRQKRQKRGFHTRNTHTAFAALRFHRRLVSSFHGVPYVFVEK